MEVSRSLRFPPFAIPPAALHGPPRSSTYVVCPSYVTPNHSLDKSVPLRAHPNRLRLGDLRSRAHDQSSARRDSYKHQTAHNRRKASSSPRDRRQARSTALRLLTTNHGTAHHNETRGSHRYDFKIIGAAHDIGGEARCFADDQADDSNRRLRLKFSFRYQPWQDVLDWFADQAGLSLLMEAAAARYVQLLRLAHLHPARSTRRS